jgi:hypothetical protein
VLSQLVRRVHMYLALFLFPWILMYALSTLVMNHRALLAGRPRPIEKERELIYDGIFPEPAAPRTKSRQILASVGLDGSHSVTERPDGAIVITRNDLVTPRRLTYTPADHRLVIERTPFRSGPFLERFHRRRGYATTYRLDTAWAASVDLVIAAMVFWALSGLWMWWEMKATRGLGALALCGGVGLFALFLLTL